MALKNGRDELASSALHARHLTARGTLEIGFGLMDRSIELKAKKLGAGTEGTVGRICQYLGAHDIVHVLVGGAAVLAFGVLRTVGDLGLVVRLRPRAIERFVDILGIEGFRADLEGLEEALDQRTRFPLRQEGNGLSLSLRGAYCKRDRSLMEGRKVVELHGVAFPLESPEDAIADYLRSDRAQDVMDAEGIYLRQHPCLDMGRLERICKALKVRRRLARMRKRMGPYLERFDRHLGSVGP
jgi:hypothetical protein